MDGYAKVDIGLHVKRETGVLAVGVFWRYSIKIVSEPLVCTIHIDAECLAEVVFEHETVAESEAEIVLGVALPWVCGHLGCVIVDSVEVKGVSGTDAEIRSPVELLRLGYITSVDDPVCKDGSASECVFKKARCMGFVVVVGTHIIAVFEGEARTVAVAEVVACADATLQVNEVPGLAFFKECTEIFVGGDFRSSVDCYKQRLDRGNLFLCVLVELVQNIILSKNGVLRVGCG